MFVVNGNTAFQSMRGLYEALASKCGSILCFHAGKSYEQLDYLDCLQCSNRKLIKRIARTVFQVEDVSDNRKVFELIEQFAPGQNGQLHFVIDKRIFQRSYQYLRFGSESLFTLADELRKALPIDPVNKYSNFI